jgi:hypothetical protein
MTTARKFSDDEGNFTDWSPAAEKCRNPTCGSELHVWVRLWESHDGAYEDHQYRCWHCGHVWWVDGIDS